MSVTVTVTMTNDTYRRTVWLLKARYGKRKGDKSLFTAAVLEIAAREAQHQLETQGYHNTATRPAAGAAEGGGQAERRENKSS